MGKLREALLILSSWEQTWPCMPGSAFGVSQSGHPPQHPGSEDCSQESRELRLNERSGAGHRWGHRMDEGKGLHGRFLDKGGVG